MTTLQIRGVSLFVEVMGGGYPLLLMHGGGPGLDYTTMLPFRALSDQFTLVFYDHRCNGRSEGAPVSSMTWENLTADADALREALGFDRWAILGHSFGGMVALEYALRYPKSLSHLLLLDTAGDGRVQQNAPEILAKRGYSSPTVNLSRRFVNGEIAENELMTAMIKFGSAYYYHHNPLVLVHEMISARHMKYRHEAFVFGFSQLLKHWTVMDRLTEIKVPTLVLAGRHDFLFPPEHQGVLAAGIANARLEIIECAGHNAHSERNAEVLQAIKDFMAA